MRNDTLTTWLRRPPRECARATARLIRAAAVDGDHAKAFGEAMRSLPAVLRERRRLPDDVERLVALLDD
jgi:hypothetical protein